MFVTNLALPLTPATGDEWEEKVSTYTVSRIRIPPVGGDRDRDRNDDDDDEDDDHHRKHD
jgi:hypothetical protein